MGGCDRRWTKEAFVLNFVVVANNVISHYNLFLRSVMNTLDCTRNRKYPSNKLFLNNPTAASSDILFGQYFPRQLHRHIENDATYRRGPQSSINSPPVDNNRIRVGARCVHTQHMSPLHSQHSIDTFIKTTMSRLHSSPLSSTGNRFRYKKKKKQRKQNAIARIEERTNPFILRSYWLPYIPHKLCQIPIDSFVMYPGIFLTASVIYGLQTCSFLSAFDSVFIIVWRSTLPETRFMMLEKCWRCACNQQTEKHCRNCLKRRCERSSIGEQDKKKMTEKFSKKKKLKENYFNVKLH